jgi:hypothetical protein
MGGVDTQPRLFPRYIGLKMKGYWQASNDRGGKGEKAILYQIHEVIIHDSFLT